MAQTIARTGVLDRADLFLPSDQSSKAEQYPSNDPRPPSPGLDEVYTAFEPELVELAKSGRNGSQGTYAKDWDAAYQARFASGRSHPFAMPHQKTRFPEDNGPSLMSWWPMPDSSEQFEARENVELPTKPTEKKEQSLIQRLEHRLGDLLFGAGEHQHSSGRPMPKPAQDVSESKSLFNVVLTLTHMPKDMNSSLQGVLVCGTYDSLPTAKAFAHQCLFNAGYEQEWFTTFKTQHEGVLVDHKQNMIVKAIGPSGEEFIVNISTIPNVFRFKSNDDGRIEQPLYHVVQTITHFRDDESGQTRDTTIHGTFGSPEEAREAALSTLLWQEDGITRNTYAAYDEAGPGEADCGYGENVIVHAIGDDGENCVVSVLKGQATESKPTVMQPREPSPFLSQKR